MTPAVDRSHARHDGREPLVDEAFASYSHDDEVATYGRVSRVVQDIQNSYKSLTGSTLFVFLDRSSISLGEPWKHRIAAGIESSLVLLAFVSPAYLRSGNCRREFRGFLTAQPGRLAIPLLFAERK